jgi:hypothetical protein
MSDDLFKLINKTGAKFDSFFAAPERPNEGASPSQKRYLGKTKTFVAYRKSAANGFLPIAPELQTNCGNG